MPQTREHIAACDLLGIRRAVVAVTKVDKAGEDLARLAGEEASELLGDRIAAEVVFCSGKTGEGLDRLRDAVRRALVELAPPPAGARARLSVDRVFSVRGAGTVVTGTLVEGRLAVGAPVRVMGVAGARETTVRGLHVHDRSVDEARAPTRLAINLAGLPLDAVHRGDVVTDDPSVTVTRTADVVLREGAKVRPGAVASLYVGTARATVRVDPIRAAWAGEATGETAEPAIRFARLRLARPIAIVGGDRFVLRGSDLEGPSGAVIGGGVVLDARPPRVKPKAKRRAVLEALAAGDATAAARALAIESAPKPVARDALGARFVVPSADLAKAAEKLVERGELARIRTTHWIERAALVDLARKARRLVAEHHRQAPLDRGMGLETLRKRLAESAGPEAADDAIRAAATARSTIEGEPIVVEGDIVRSPSFAGAPTSGAVADALDAATRAVVAAGLKGVSENALREATGATPREVRAILAKLVRDGVALHAGDLWFARAAYDDLRARVVAHLAASARLTIADFKALCGLGRKQAIPLLEQLDREGVTRREGDDRVPGAALRTPT